MNNTCIFCQRPYHTIATIQLADNSQVYDRVVKCPECKVTTYFKLGEIISQCYYLDHTKYEQITMNVCWNKTTLIFTPSFPDKYMLNQKSIDFTGTWVNTHPSKAIHLADRLNNLLTFLWAIPASSATNPVIHGYLTVKLAKLIMNISMIR